MTYPQGSAPRNILRSTLAAAIASASVIWAIPNAALAASTLILECKGPAAAPGTHSLYEFDLDAKTVFMHAVNDDGAPYTVGRNQTSEFRGPVEITDEQISWSRNTGEKEPDRYTLGRYSGDLRWVYTLSGFNDGKSHTFTQKFACERYVSPQQHDRKF